jgi:hypothetical protein
MRKIEREMIEAINMSTDWSKDNTRVVNVNNISKVYLHGNLIAEYLHDYNQLIVDEKTFRKWPTKTTRSRLYAMGVDKDTLTAILNS